MPTSSARFTRGFLASWLLGIATAPAAPVTDFAPQREQVAALGKLISPPALHAAEGFAVAGTINPLFFEGLSYQGKPTRVFA